MDHAHLDPESGVRHDGDGRHRGARPVRLQPAAGRADARGQSAFRTGADQLPGCESRGRRDRRHEAARVRDQHGRGRELDPLQFDGGTQPGVRRVPDVDRHEQGDERRARQDRAGQAFVPARCQGPSRHSRRPGEPAAGRVARGDVADVGPARPELTHRSDHRQRARERARRRAHGRQRAGDPADPDPGQAAGSLGAGHRRRPGDHRHPEREPGRAGRPHHARPDRRDRAGRGQDQGSDAVRARHRRAADGRARLPLAGRRRDRRREGAGFHRANQRASGDHDRHPEGTGREHRRHRQGRRRSDRGAEEADPEGRRAPDHQLERRPGGEERQPREADDRRGRAPDRADRVPVPPQLAQHDHHRPHAADRGDRDVPRALRVRLHAQLPDADGAVLVHRPPDRRRDRRAREHRPPPGDGQGSPARGAGGDRRDRRRGDGDDVRDRRRIRTDRVHERAHRALLLPVRRDGRGGGAGLAVRLVHARSDAVLGLARPAGVALSQGAVARPVHGTRRARHRVGARGLRPNTRVGARFHEAPHLHSSDRDPRCAATSRRAVPEAALGDDLAPRDRAVDRVARFRGQPAHRRARRHRVRPRRRRELYLAAPQYPGGLEP